MQVLQVLQARHLFASSFSSDSNSLKVIELLATKSLPEDSLYSTAVVDTYDILPPLQIAPRMMCSLICSLESPYHSSIKLAL